MASAAFHAVARDARGAEVRMERADFEGQVERLGSGDWRVRQAASAALAGAGEAALDALIGGLAHPDWRVRAGCAAVMDHLADGRCGEPLARALDDPGPPLRRWAVHSISCQRCKAAALPVDIVGRLIERALRDPSVRVRQVSVHALGLQPPDPRAAAALRTILARESNRRLLSRARWALEQHEPDPGDRKPPLVGTEG